jgi:hypothetical protein
MFGSHRPLPQQGGILVSRLETTEDILKSCSLLPNLGWSEILIRYHAVWLVDWISRHHDLWGRKRARMTGGGGDMPRRGSWRRHIGKLSRRKDLDWLIAPMKRVRLCICLSWWSNRLELKENKSYGRDHTYVPFISRINVEASTVPLISKYKMWASWDEDILLGTYKNHAHDSPIPYMST